MAKQREPKVAVVGATGAVGNQLVELLESRAFPRGDLGLFASAAGAADTVEIGGREFTVEEFGGPADLGGFDLAFLALPQERALEIVRAAPGPLLIDLSAAAREPSGRPLVAPGITPREKLDALSGATVFETPHPAAHALATILQALDLKTGFVGACLLAGASAGGSELIAATAEQSAALLSGRLDLEEGAIQRAFNLFISGRERATAGIIRAQVAALMERSPDLALQTMAAPLLHGSALALAAPFSGASERWPERLRAAPGVLFLEDSEPLGVIDALGQEAIVVRMERQAAGITLFGAFDNTRLAALSAIWAAENLLLTSQ